MTVGLLIRRFGPADYEPAAALKSAALLGFPQDPEEMRHDDRCRPAECKAVRWVAESGGQMAGYGEYLRSASRYHPQKFFIYVYVHPDFQGRGSGRALYRHLRAEMEPLEPIALLTDVREPNENGLRFAERRGFAEAQRNWESQLSLAEFDPTPWLGTLERTAAAKIEIRSLTELQSDPERDRRLYDLFTAVNRDLPATIPRTDQSYEYFREHTFGNPGFLPEGCFVALTATGEYIGLTELTADSGDGILWTGLTGVRREFRNRGVAHALKVTALVWARASGKQGVRTFNASTNGPMLAINQRLGFVRKPAWINLALVLREE